MFQSYSNQITEAVDFVEDLKNKFESTSGNASLAENFNLPGFWTTLNVHSQKMILDVSKFSLALTEVPNVSSSDFSHLLNCIQSDLGNISSEFCTFPKEIGSTLRSTLVAALVKIASACSDYYKFLLNSRSESTFKKEVMTTTAIVWAACEEVAELPIDNKDAVLKIIEIEESLVIDAFDEITLVLETEKEMSLQTGGDQDMIWNNEQFEMVEKAVAVVKTTKALCSKLKIAARKNGQCTSGTQIAQLDDLVENFKKVSPAVDDFILSLYPPCNFNYIRSNVTLLRNVMHTLLQKAKNCHYVKDEDFQWISFLSLATTHNCNKIETSSAPVNNNPASPLIILSDLSLN